MLADLGGADALSTLKLHAVDHLAVVDTVLNCMAATYLSGGAFDPASFGTLINSYRRLAADVGWDRAAKDVTPDLEDMIEHHQRVAA